MDKSSHQLNISISPDNTKKSTKVPAHIPPMCTLHYALMNCIDIRSSPRKVKTIETSNSFCMILFTMFQ